ncbi:MAG TPA: site-specific DNA-methyltransferase [Candidatus Nanopelagicaceae bacterium]|nr:site-specific DNA-methyltransferase [Candidatus Nanopelagicaceae bacterium]
MHNCADYSDGVAQVHLGDARFVLGLLPAESVQCCVTSPPYWGLRDYGLGSWQGGDPECSHATSTEGDPRRFTNGRGEGTAGDGTAGTSLTSWTYRDATPRRCTCGATRTGEGIGLEPTPEEWVAKLVAVFAAVRRVLRPDGTLWLNVGDAYGSGTRASRDYSKTTKHGYWNNPCINQRNPSPAKQLLMLPARLALALQADGWFLRSDIIWAKPNPMPESVTDRPTSSYEHMFLLTKSPRYFYDQEAIREESVVGDHPRNVRESMDSMVPGAPAHSGIRHQIPRSQTFARDGAVADHVLPGQSAAQHRRDHKLPQGWDTSVGGNGHHQPGRFKQDGHAEASAGGGDRWTGFNGRYFDEDWQPRQEQTSRNSRNVWTIATRPYPGAHFATFPEELARRCIAAGTKERDVVLDPFAGSGTTLAVAKRLNRDSIGIELQPDYLPLIVHRLEGVMAQMSLPLSMADAEMIGLPASTPRCKLAGHEGETAGSD